MVPNTDDALLTRDKTAEALTEAGYRISARTLATKVSRGGGPPYAIFSARALYRWGDALTWARELTSATRRTTSERDARQAAG